LDGECAADGYIALIFRLSMSRNHIVQSTATAPRISMRNPFSTRDYIILLYPLILFFLPPLSPNPDPEHLPTHPPPFPHLINQGDRKTPRATKIDDVGMSLRRLVCPGHASAVGYIGFVRWCKVKGEVVLLICLSDPLCE